MRSIRFHKYAAAVIAVSAFACAGGDTAPEAPPVRAEIATAEARALPDLHAFAGTVRALNVSQLSSRVMGDVVAVHVREGDRVTRGQVLVEIDDRDAASQLSRARAEGQGLANAIDSAAAAVRAAEAQASLAETTWRRFHALRERGSVSLQEYDEAEARHRSAAAQLQSARQAHAQIIANRAAASASIRQAETFSTYTRIRAPFDGVITARHVDPGTQASPGMTLLTVDEASNYRAEATVDETTHLAAGDEVTVESAGTSVRARVRRIVPSLDPQTRSALVTIDLPKSDRWRSGAFARILIATGRREAITIPSAALIRRGQLASVYALAPDGVAHLRLVTTGETAGEHVEILSGLSAGERVVVRPQAAMREGIRVTGAGA